MGAIGVRQTIIQLRALGFLPIELERYCSSNKIWTTKVKRLRLPDLLCVRTGLRLEVRAKSDLQIKMSDAPNNPERTWDAGLRNDDVAAFIAIVEDEGGQRAADEAVFFRIGELRDSVGQSRLGPPKSASEGAERDRTWPSIVPSANGIVHSVTAERLIVEMVREGRARQTYALRGKSVYVRPGQRFNAGISILAGAPTQLANLAAFTNRQYEPLDELRAANAIDRYAAVKALPYRDDLRQRAVAALEELLAAEQEQRVALEAAGSAAALGSTLGQERIAEILWGEGRNDFRMEAVLILTELASPFARDELLRVASDQHFADNEIRQAAVWGLGKAGLRAYDLIVPFIDHQDENLAAHAIVAFGSDTPEPIIRQLVQKLIRGEPRGAAAASEVLKLIGNEITLNVLIEAAETGVLATLGRLPPGIVRPAIMGTKLMSRVAPVLLLSEDDNWLATDDRVIDIAFLTKQNL